VSLYNLTPSTLRKLENHPLLSIWRGDEEFSFLKNVEAVRSNQEA